MKSLLVAHTTESIAETTIIHAVASSLQKGHHEHTLTRPVLHIQGPQDLYIHLHRLIHERYCERGSSRIVEWDRGHRVSIMKVEAEARVEQILLL